MAFKVVKARKEFKVEYPALYATKADHPSLTDEQRQTFNCHQRAHQNSLEMLPSYLGLLAAAGVRHPATSAALGASYLLGRVFYVQGYSTGDPAKRMSKGSAFMYIGILGLAVTATKAAVELLLPRK